MDKNKQRFKQKVIDKLLWAKYRGEIQVAIRTNFKKGCSSLKLKSLNSSLKNKIFKTHKEGKIK